MATDGDSFRAVLAQWPSGVVIVTTGTPGGGWHGMTASSFSSVSVDPPLVLVCLARSTRTHRLIQERGTFAVSVLGRDQAELGRRFAGRDLLQDAVAAARPVPLRVRLRERHGIGMVNALIAMKSGVRLFDTTLGGVDGALPGEDVLFLAEQLNVASPVDRTALIAGAVDLETCWGSSLPGRTYRSAC
ncbi:flavin reductase [Streptosporangium roseum]|uniref:flavin reductase n=1 Tax=Streptosporangium roseum TaxID=2001 RepID=UPI0033275DA0